MAYGMYENEYEYKYEYKYKYEYENKNGKWNMNTKNYMHFHPVWILHWENEVKWRIEMGETTTNNTNSTQTTNH